jgi:hypothetical protein
MIDAYLTSDVSKLYPVSNYPMILLSVLCTHKVSPTANKQGRKTRPENKQGSGLEVKFTLNWSKIRMDSRFYDT